MQAQQTLQRKYTNIVYIRTRETEKGEIKGLGLCEVAKAREMEGKEEGSR